MLSINQLYGMNIHYRYYDLEYFFKSCSQNKIENVEIWLCPQHFYINAFFSEKSEKIKKLMEKYKISVKCLCPEQNNPKPNNIAAREENLIQYTYQYFKKVIDLANAINSDLVLITPGWNYYDEDPSKARKRSISMIKKLSDYAQERNITLVLESIWNKSSLVGDTIEKIQQIKGGVNRPNLKLALDLGAINSAQESIEEWFQVFGADIAHCHFVDGNPTGHLPWGEGELSMENTLKAFSNHNYSGGFSMEYLYQESFKNPEIWDLKTKVQFQKCIKIIEGDLND
ncbi:sugar phosphate isomerase/epimerase family protein [Amphibacillus sp. Q70]|uniref:sugar phosphate isomerase/epimerase family protein n=1 Tax=Amphibacillus sp. Q70 TaxID=3453416 RepID=UPI003F85B06C